MYAKVENGEVIKYPYTVADLRRDNPRTAFPVSVDLSTVDGVVPVQATEPPSVSAGQQAVEGVPVLSGDQWVQTWAVEALPVPRAVTRKQARLALVNSGILIETVEAAILAIADPVERDRARVNWADSENYYRDDPVLLTLAAALGLTDEQLDGLFLIASGL